MTDMDHSEVLQLLRNQEQAIARGDAAGVISALDRRIVFYDLPPPLEIRAPEATDPTALEQWFASWEDGVTVEMPDPQILIDGDLAVVFGLSRMQGTKVGEGPIDAWSRRTVVLKRLHGNWRIIHEHGSFPMAMDGSGKAVTDLQPN